MLDATPEDVVYHIQPKCEIVATIYHLNLQLKFGRVFLSGGLLRNESAALATFPDGIAIRWETIESDQLQIVKQDSGSPEAQGSPDWVLEVVSPSSVTKDKKTLRTAYHAAGIREYWIVDARGEEVEFAILTWTEAGYVAAVNTDGWQASPVFGRAFKFSRTIDSRGYFEYSLNMRPAKSSSRSASSSRRPSSKWGHAVRSSK